MRKERFGGGEEEQEEEKMPAEMQRPKLNRKVGDWDDPRAGFTFKWAFGPSAWNPATYYLQRLVGIYGPLLAWSAINIDLFILLLLFFIFLIWT